jgi:uncharacterized protein YaaR (DUF327 family)
MAKVDSPDGILNPAVYSTVLGEAKKNREKNGPRGAGKADFSRILKETEARETEAAAAAPPSEEALQELLDAVHSSGDDLKNRPLPDNIKRYKQAVRNFLSYVVKNSYTVEEQISRVRIKRGTDPDSWSKKYTQVQITDRKLEELAAAILSGQATQLDILGRIEEINGILVNLLR